MRVRKVESKGGQIIEAPLKDGFEKEMHRKPKDGEGDFVFSEQDLLAFSAPFWHGLP